ncbi:cobalamin B12-binding domain-containing protein [Labedaea rhizosphaerae]|jgi:methylaspartate mutase sigma subunit|uniref:Methylaspartate mutase sigma subunit n=1 Tax=Labedaea rhizosphaerae TaxID=598644 RepID=A0A4R6SKG3_LABRH|nr:cobalamin-dependent protein [Labedaea rhizosphaerae]TDQ04407.1 methylaspartate mutase sigma subunit [Labedaea rhizosphaerae]
MSLPDSPGVIWGNSADPARVKATVVVTSMASDSHTWNLVYLQLLLEELGYDVVNLGSCVPDDLLISSCAELRPALVVVSSVNGHGYADGMRVIDKLRACDQLVATPVVIGGKLGIDGAQTGAHIHNLMASGFDAVFDDTATGIQDFNRFVCAIPAKTQPEQVHWLLEPTPTGRL